MFGYAVGGSPYIGASINIVRDEYTINNGKAVSGGAFKDFSKSARQLLLTWNGTQNELDQFLQALAIPSINGGAVPGLPLNILIDWDGSQASFADFTNTSDLYEHVGQAFVEFASLQSSGMMDISAATTDFYVNAGQQIMASLGAPSAPLNSTDSADLATLASFFVTTSPLPAQPNDNFFLPIEVTTGISMNNMLVTVWDQGSANYEAQFELIKSALATSITGNIIVSPPLPPPTPGEEAAASLASNASGIGVGGSLFAGYAAYFSKVFFLAGELGWDLQDNTVGSSSKNEMIVRNGLGVYGMLRVGFDVDPVSIYANLGGGFRNIEASYQYLTFNFAQSFIHGYYLLGSGLEARLSPNFGVFVEFNTKFNPVARELSSFPGVTLKLKQEQVRVGGRYYLAAIKPVAKKTYSQKMALQQVSSKANSSENTSQRDSLYDLRRRMKELEIRIKKFKESGGAKTANRRRLEVLEAKIEEIKSGKRDISPANVKELEQIEGELL